MTDYKELKKAFKDGILSHIELMKTYILLDKWDTVISMMDNFGTPSCPVYTADFGVRGCQPFFPARCTLAEAITRLAEMDRGVPHEIIDGQLIQRTDKEAVSWQEPTE